MKYFLMFLATSGLLQSCGQITTTNTNQHPEDWGYQGETAPEHWAELSQSFFKCAEGHFQSPIDIESYVVDTDSGKSLKFYYHPSPVDLVNNGHTVQAVPEEENYVEVEGYPYRLQQIHFHEPAEHRVDGIIYPMEMHMVHSDSAGNITVVGIFIKEGPENTDLQALWESLPEHPAEHKHPNERCDIVHLLPEDGAVFHYTGSLTTPPCSEGVEWFVMEKPIRLSKSQIERFKKLYHGNNRPIQKRGDSLLSNT
ncbi:MAG: carbonic anhydrase family protein [Bacteroidetes bacterium]|nr:carbonic anhydrase family protein [Bacteroidota bacterium]